MARPLRTALFSLVALTGSLGLGLGLFYLSIRQVPAFYQAAIELDEAQQHEANDDCLRQVAALASDLMRPGEWQAVFTADQINGWLAVDLLQNYPQALPPEIKNPRVDLHDGVATVACTYHSGQQETVLSISFDVYLQDPNVIALRVRGVRAGLVPAPLTEVLAVMAEAARNSDFDLQWRQASGDPVALLTIAPSRGEHSLRLDAIEFHEGELYLAGQTSQAEATNLVEQEATSESEIAPSSATQIDEPSSEESAEATNEEDPLLQAREESAENENVQR